MSLPSDSGLPRVGRAAQPPPWGIPATILWVLVAFILSVVVATAVFAVWQSGQSAPRAVAYDGVVITIGALASVPVQVAVLALAAQWRGWHPLDYLGIDIPRRGELVFAVLCVVAINLAFDGLLYLSGGEVVPSFQAEAYRSASDAGWLGLMTIAVVLVAPVGEEMIFRGFLFRGLARPGWEKLAIAAISLAWALLHIQYDLIGMMQIFVVGLLLGWFRWASGSTTVTIFMHVLINAEAMIETAIKIGAPS